MTDNADTRYRVLVTGGYGFFGKRLAMRLALDPLLDVVLAGRDGGAAEALAQELNTQTSSTRFSALALDIHDPALADLIRASGARLLIHTSGPFQQQGYQVAQACIACGVHYIDLADSREFVVGIGALNEAARAAGVLVVSGASSVPALSGAALDALAPDFVHIHAIDIGISPGNRTERGLATIRAILSYAGAPMQQWQGGRWQRRFGWQDLRRQRYPHPVGARWLANCDVPDLTLWQQRFPGVHEVRFGAGLQLPLLHFGLWLMAGLRRFGLARDWSRHAARLKTMSDWFLQYGSSAGAMHVQIDGVGHHCLMVRRRWTLVALRGDGPYIPTLAGVILAGRLARGTLEQRGAMPCTGMLTLDDFYDAMGGLAVVMDICKA